METTDGRGAAPGRRLSTTDRVYGAIAAIAIVLALWFLVRGGGPDTSGTAGRPTRITVEDPQPGAVLDQPVVLTFNLRTKVGSDGTDSVGFRHVHVNVGEKMLMANPGEIRPVTGTTYRWVLPPLPRGTTWIRVYWSDAAHRAIAGATSDSVQVTVR